MSAGGSIQEVTLKNRRFAVAADAEANRKLGGFENEVQANGDGSVRLVKTRVPFRLDSLQLSIDDNAQDQEFLQALADSNELFPVTITLVSGNTYQGVGQITGEVQTSTQNQTCTITLEGQAKLTIQ
jgi:hypothetical protein